MSATIALRPSGMMMPVSHRAMPVCKALPIRESVLGQDTMGEVSGEGFIAGFVGGVLGGIVVYAITQPHQVMDTIRWYSDAIAELMPPPREWGDVNTHHRVCEY